MTSPRNGSGTSPVRETVVHFRLYIAGQAPRSLMATVNLKAMCEQYLPNRHRIEIVDMLKEPVRALSDGILVTPTLVKISPLPAWKIIGDLSDIGLILRALGLEQQMR